MPTVIGRFEPQSLTDPPYGMSETRRFARIPSFALPPGYCFHPIDFAGIEARVVAQYIENYCTDPLVHGFFRKSALARIASDEELFDA